MCKIVKETLKIFPVTSGRVTDTFCASIWLLSVFSMMVSEATEMKYMTTRAVLMCICCVVLSYQ